MKIPRPAHVNSTLTKTLTLYFFLIYHDIVFLLSAVFFRTLEVKPTKDFEPALPQTASRGRPYSLTVRFNLPQTLVFACV